MKFIYLICFVIITQAGQAQDAHIVLRTDKNGRVSHGSIESLIDHVQAGRAIRVGWEMDSNRDGQFDIIHWTDAKFLTVLNGQVFNQIDPIYRQVPKIREPQIKLMESEMKWVAIVGTNGKLVHRFIMDPNMPAPIGEGKSKLEKLAKIRETIVPTSWAVKK